MRFIQKSWCTGEDSNLRSSWERQIYSLLPLTTRPPVHSQPSKPKSVSPETPHENRSGSPDCPTCFQRALSLAAREDALRAFHCHSHSLQLWESSQLPRNHTSAATGAAGRFSTGGVLLKRCAFYGNSPDCRAQSWSWRRDLNPRPSDYKSDALPAELRQHSENSTDRRQKLPAINSKHGQKIKVTTRKWATQPSCAPASAPRQRRTD